MKPTERLGNEGGAMIQGSSRYIAFFDECGDHTLAKADLDFPVFLLSTVIVEREAYFRVIVPGLNEFKLRFWDHEGINLHSRDIRKASKAYSFLQNPSVRNTFLTQLSKLMDELPYTLFITAIDKTLLKTQYAVNARNPYALALTFTFERILGFMEVNKEKHLPVIAEARGKSEDRELETEFYKLMTQGTDIIHAERFKELSCPLLFEDKKKNICGTQLADLCAYPAARHILKPDQPNQAFDIVRKHIFIGTGQVKGWKVFPKRNE
jgi:hypothetical protein